MKPLQGRAVARVWPACALGVASALMLLQLALMLGWQLPAPAGDGVLFASVAQYHCGTGRFETPIFPLDPQGDYRYVWHGIGWPWLLSQLNPGCSLPGSFVALSAVMVATSACVGWAFAGRTGRMTTLALVLTVFALQAKMGFRPETLAILLVLLAHALRSRADPWWHAGMLSLLAWVQPTVFILAAAHALLTQRSAGWRALWRSAALGVPALLAVHAFIALAYPFPLADLIGGLSLQAQRFALRGDGSLFTYFVRSDFFPLIGLAMAAAIALSIRQRPLLGLLLPLVFFFGPRVPPAYYNLVPLFVALLAGLVDGDHGPRPRPAALAGVLALSAVLAAAGLAQSGLRGAVSAWHEPGTPLQALHAVQRIQGQGQVVCEVPLWFTLLLPAMAFEPGFERARLTACSGPAERRVDLVPGSPSATGSEAGLCTALGARRALPSALARLFSGSAGYGLTACPAGAG